MELYRPISMRELSHISQTDFSAFPPCSSGSDFFYIKVRLEQAEAIARGWSIKSADKIGMVAKFVVEDEYVQKFPVQTTGSKETGSYESLCIPAGELAEFNLHIIGKIKVEVICYDNYFEDGER